MDFYQIKESEGAKKDKLNVYPDFQVIRSKDLMVRGKSFYAIWDEVRQVWSTDEFDVARLVDEDIRNHEVKTPGLFDVQRKYLNNFSSSSWLSFRNYVGHLTDNFHQIDENLTFANTEAKKEDYVSKRLPYPLLEGDISAWDELVSTLYNPEERAKIEWAIGAVVSGDSKTIQKFLVFYGSAGTGKSTILNIIQWLFEGYWTAFVARELASSNNSFALEAFKNNPLVGIEHDGDLSKVQDNSKLNSLVAHEAMEINEKNKPKYMMRFITMLFIGSNAPVKITDSRSGLIRRLIDISPTGKTIPARKYQTLMAQIKFELGAIAHHCLEVYRAMGRDYYSGYKPIAMMLQTDVFFNFVEAHYDIFSDINGVTLKRAWELYKEYIKETGVEYSLPQYKMKEELKSYFNEFHDRIDIDGQRIRSLYLDFNADRFKSPTGKKEEGHMFSLVIEEAESIFDKEYADAFAQYSNAAGTPVYYWNNDVRKDMRTGKEFIPKPDQVVKTSLAEIDTSKEHYVKVPQNHIVIDFDLTDADGHKSLERNLEAASQWPATYAEFSRSGQGIHLHYDYIGDVEMLERVYEDGIEIKVYTGNTALRRKLTRCNNIPVATLAGGLPLKEEKKVMNEREIKSEKALRDLIGRNLRKEIHSGTKPSMEFIHTILDEAYRSPLSYDVSDLRNKMYAFANNSTNHAAYCLNLVSTMQLKSEDKMPPAQDLPDEDRLVFFDVEVFSNLFVVCWKYKGDANVVRMINPSSQDIEQLLGMKLVGFNCRRYDNHILYAAFLGYTNEQLYKLSQKLIANAHSAYFGQAYNLSYADIYDFSSKKQSLKKFEIELGLHHLESNHPWDQPVPDELIEAIVNYCVNDVMATEAVFDARIEDFIAREILADLSGLPVNATTQNHTAKIVFGDDKAPQEKFIYTDLSEMFPGYKFDAGKSEYRGEITGEGGYVYAEPGMYENVALLDIQSMHPTSIDQMDMFGEYTQIYASLTKARLAIKRGDYDAAKEMFGGRLARHLTNAEQAEALGYALKIVVNIVYGLTSARFSNPFKDPRNIDNIVAKRGALFMIELKHFVQSKGFTVAHIKTDSIKIPNATKEIIEAVMEFGERYGYTFVHEATYEKFCLVNDAVYIAYVAQSKKPAHWEAVGAQFQHPYVFKSLFSKDKIDFDDLCETKEVKTSLTLDFNDPTTEYDPKKREFVGRIGRFTPVKEKANGGFLMRVDKDDPNKFIAATGTKGYKWLESENVKSLNLMEEIDIAYFQGLVDKAVATISEYGDFESFVA